VDKRETIRTCPIYVFMMKYLLPFHRRVARNSSWGGELLRGSSTRRFLRYFNKINAFLGINFCFKTCSDNSCKRVGVNRVGWGKFHETLFPEMLYGMDFR